MAYVANVYMLQPSFVTVDPFGFDPESTREKFEPVIKEAQDQGLVPVLSHERLSGSPYAGGYDSGLVADRLAATFPEARVLVVIREQKGMISSVYKQYVRAGGAATFRQYVNAPRGRARMPVFRFEFFEYHRLISYYQSLFSPDNVLVLPHELLQAQPEAFLGRIGAFLDVPAVNSTVRQIHISPSALALSLKRHVNRYFVRDGLNPAPPFEVKDLNKALLKKTFDLDNRLPSRLRDWYERCWRRYVEGQVGDRYAKSNAITAELTGLNLRRFGYAL